MGRSLRLALCAAFLAAPTTAPAQQLSATVLVTDNGAPSTFAFTFATPITPLTGTVTYTFEGFLTLIDGGRDGVSAAPALLPEFFRLEVFNGTTWVLVDDIGGTATLAGAGTTTLDASGIVDCAAIGACTLMQLQLAFALSGNEDQLIGSGTFALAPATVPEPGSLALLGVGALWLLGRRRRE